MLQTSLMAARFSMTWVGDAETTEAKMAKEKMPVIFMVICCTRLIFRNCWDGEF